MRKADLKPRSLRCFCPGQGWLSVASPQNQEMGAVPQEEGLEYPTVSARWDVSAGDVSLARYGEHRKLYVR